MNKKEKDSRPEMGMPMMKKMMEGMKGAPPMEQCMKMCKQMTGAVAETAAMASYSTDEVRGLFEEWIKVVEDEILGFVEEKGTCDPSGIAAKIAISDESALYFISKMAREGKLNISEVKL
ncbi:hypothetical protein MNBD_NITROSPINAE03-1997 [hydrothermal vent metagenome]|uniref:Uncharacterized protein n=1 Tax=hydrothermal vent metagenome TaxID=652676 RepID=A0A3B1CEA1_9ZZZZ